MGRKETPDQRGLRETQDPTGSQVHLVKKDLLDQQGHPDKMVKREIKVTQENQGNRAILEHRDLKDHRDHQDLRDKWDHLDQMENEVHKDHKGLGERRDQMDHGERRDL